MAHKFQPSAKLEAYHANIKDSQFNVDWFATFDLVFNALDNLDARRHVNRMCLAANVPLIESGTTGFNGQVQVIKKVSPYSPFLPHIFTNYHRITPSATTVIQRKYPRPFQCAPSGARRANPFIALSGLRVTCSRECYASLRALASNMSNAVKRALWYQRR